MMAAAEVVWVFPDQFAYINPIFGGRYRAPLVLHDSNFDGGQDLRRLQHAVKQGDFGERKLFAFLNTKTPLKRWDGDLAVPEQAMVIRILQRHLNAPCDIDRADGVLVVSRGFEAPMPWTELFGRRLRIDPRISALLPQVKSEAFLTPTLAVIHFSHDDVSGNGDDTK